MKFLIKNFSTCTPKLSVSFSFEISRFRFALYFAHSAWLDIKGLLSDIGSKVHFNGKIISHGLRQ